MFKHVIIPNTTLEYHTNVDFNCRLCGDWEAETYYRVEGPTQIEREYECEGCYKKA